MARYKIGDLVTYAGNKDVYTVVNYYSQGTSNCYLLENTIGVQHLCYQQHALRIYKRAQYSIKHKRN